MPKKNNAAAIVLPQPHEISDSDKDDAMGAYLMTFASWGVGLPLPMIGLIIEIVYHLLNAKKSPFIAFHSLQSLLMEIPVSIANAAVFVWLILCVASVTPWHYSLALVAIATALLNLVFIICSVIGCVRARKGLFYYFPITGRIAFNRYFVNPRKRAEKKLTNAPPAGL
ncbi:MAG: DUF4870 domain-containing protein [Spirochaetota bacterium]